MGSCGKTVKVLFEGGFVKGSGIRCGIELEAELEEEDDEEEDGEVSMAIGLRKTRTLVVQYASRTRDAVRYGARRGYLINRRV